MTSTGSDVRIGILARGGRRAIAALEETPIDSLWVGGHIVSRNPVPEAMMALARLAAVTDRVTIGTSILLLPLYPPALVAKQIADLDRASGGRVVLGVGIGGEYPQEFSAVGVPVEERGRRANESIPLIRRLWTERHVTHDGRYYRMVDVSLQPPPLQVGGPPIVIAGRKEAAMRRAATLGDGWFPYLYSPRRYAESVATIHQVAAEAGRDLAEFHWCVWVFVNIDPDGDLAREQCARSIGGTYEQDVRPMVDRVAAAGTAREVTAKLVDFYDAGARHFIFHVANDSDDPGPVVDCLFGEVVPALHSHAAAARDTSSETGELRRT